MTRRGVLRGKAEGFTAANISIEDSSNNTAGLVQSISKAATTNIYTVRIRANADIGVSSSGNEADETLTVTLAADAVSATVGSTTYSNASAVDITVSVDQSKPKPASGEPAMLGFPVPFPDSDNLVNGKFSVSIQSTETVVGLTQSDLTGTNGTIFTGLSP